MVDGDTLSSVLSDVACTLITDFPIQGILEHLVERIVGVEALLRWTHPEQGAVPALTTVSIAEQNGLIGDIGAWVLERGCVDRGRWAASVPSSPWTCP